MFARRGVRVGLFATVGFIGVSGTLATNADAQVLEGNLFLRQEQTTLGYVNQVFDDYPDYSTGMGSMVSTSAIWNVSNIQIYQTGGVNTWYGNVNAAVLNVTHQVLGAPDAGVDPALPTNTGPGVVYSGVVGVVLDQGTDSNSRFRVTADTSGLAALQGLPAGDYVFSLTPMANYTSYGQSFTAVAASLDASDDWIRNAGQGFSISPDWRTLAGGLGAAAGTRWAIGINGSVVPEPASLVALLVGAGAMLASRRRR